MAKKFILITGASGVIGENLINYFFRKKKKNIIALDLNKPQNSNYIHKFYKGSILDKQLLDKINNLYIFDEIYRVMKPGGKLIITTPNYFSIWPLLEKIINFFGPIDYNFQHINYFNKRKLYKFLSKKPFDEINIETFIYFAPFTAILSWKLSNTIEKLERFFFNKMPFGFLLCATFIKKK